MFLKAAARTARRQTNRAAGRRAACLVNTAMGDIARSSSSTPSCSAVEGCTAAGALTVCGSAGNRERRSSNFDFRVSNLRVDRRPAGRPHPAAMTLRGSREVALRSSAPAATPSASVFYVPVAG